MTAICSNPNGCNDTSLTSLYPSMGLTVFLVLIFSSALGFGLGLVASSLIGPDDVRLGGTAALDQPGGEDSQAARLK